MDFLTFALLFYSTICLVALLNILFFLFSQNLLMLKNGLIKKLNFHADNKFSYFWIDILSKVCIYYLLVSIFRENNWLGKIMLTWKKISIYFCSNSTCREFQFLKWREEDGGRNIFPALIVQSQKIHKMLISVRDNDQYFFYTFDFASSQK